MVGRGKEREVVVVRLEKEEVRFGVLERRDGVCEVRRQAIDLNVRGRLRMVVGLF